jgi:soluble lytic murein transglycosylase-like protein
MLRGLRSAAAGAVAVFVITAPCRATEGNGLRGTLHESTDVDLSLALLPDLPPVAEAAFLSPGDTGAAKNFYSVVAAREARAEGIPPEVAAAVIHVESRFRPDRIGGVGEVGLMQVRPMTAALLGFKGAPHELFKPETNIELGVRYLAKAWRLANGDLCGALMRYRAGHASTRMSSLSIEYCRRARLHLASVGSPLALAPLPRADTKARVRLASR